MANRIEFRGTVFVSFKAACTHYGVCKDSRIVRDMRNGGASHETILHRLVTAKESRQSPTAIESKDIAAAVRSVTLSYDRLIAARQA